MWLNNFNETFLKNCYLKQGWDMLNFSDFSGSKTLRSICMKLPPKKCCHPCDAYVVLVWSVVICQEREFGLKRQYCLGTKAHRRQQAMVLFILCVLSLRWNYLSKLYETSPFRYTYSCILDGIFLRVRVSSVGH